MPATEDISLKGDSRSSSTTCKPLLDAATPEMFRTNAFRITGLTVDAPKREITKHFDKLKLMEKLGRGKSVHTGACALKTPPTVDEIRAAIGRLQDPEQRTIDEFFWFWPTQFGQSASDPAIKALEGGDADTALKIWERLETNPSDGFVATHNVAVLWHLMALEWENHYAKAAEFTEEKRRKTEKLWRGAFKRWDTLAVDERFWERVSTRIKQRDEPQLKIDFPCGMRATLPQALHKINAELALRYAESGRMDLAQVHVQFMRETLVGLDDVEKTMESVLARAVARLKQQIQRAQARGEKPTDAGSAASELLDHAQNSIAIFDVLLGWHNESRNDLFDKIAQEGRVLLVSYRKSTNDAALCVKVGTALLQFVSAAETRRELNQDISLWKSMVLSKTLEPVKALLKTINDSSEPPSFRLYRFRNEAIRAISKAIVGIVGSEEHLELVDSAAVVLRGVSLTAWNDHQDTMTALAANELASKYAHDTALRSRLIQDQLTLEKQRPASPRSTNERNTWEKAGYWLGKRLCTPQGLVIAGVAILLLIVVISSDSNKPSPASNSYPALPAPTPFTYTPSLRTPAPPVPAVRSPAPAYIPPTPPFNPGSPARSNNTGTYRIPQSKTAEFDRDRQALDTAKAEAGRSAAQLESLVSEIERDRTNLDRSSQFAVEAFNRKVARYNLMLEQQRAKDSAVSKMVDAYNAKLQLYSR